MQQLYSDMKKGLQQLIYLYNKFEAELKKLPVGRVSVIQRNSHNYYYHYYWENGIRRKVTLRHNDKKQQRLLKQLQRRRFIECSIPILKRDVDALERALKTFEPYDPQQICDKLSPAYQEIKKDSTLWLPNAPDLKAWMKDSYHQYKGYPESLIHETSTGLLVRSKAESMIADTLTLFGIPYRYEQILLANNKTYAPDFTILHPVSRRLMYWEHHGKMDDAGYVLDTGKKIMDYRQAGIKAGDNLIMTFENKDHPLTMREIQDTITLFLL